ncbi:CLUMA_CG004800, isoform A [Clunio marinus]|uniref:CLUMA_CG004800, isoform A n=1 Tax=Clunio marinus TaxID=568069 RepID=A0A1J1HSR3_9DIPT|nr:CLUMA_CG004800, isoform A [Clunio marinus]
MKFVIFLMIFSISCHSIKGTKDEKSISKVLRSLMQTPQTQKNRETLTKNLRHSVAMGVALGALRVEERMESNIIKLFDNFVKTVRRSDLEKAAMQYKNILNTISNDRVRLSMLRSISNIASLSKGSNAIKDSINIASKIGKLKKENPVQELKTFEVSDMEKKLQSDVQEHLKLIRETTRKSVTDLMKNLNLKTKLKLPDLPAAASSNHFERENLLNYFMKGKLGQMFKSQKQQVDDSGEEFTDKENQEEGDENFEGALDAPPAGNGGFTALIASLSGGDEGSDVGALVGVLSGAISNLLGPEGLDIPSTLATASSLITGLLAGDENFGKVLASYIGTVVDGSSGGGGAESNGEFFGNFVGTLFAELSADPEEEAGPQPKLFIDYFFRGIEQSKQKRDTEDSEGAETEENKGGGSAGFISELVSSFVGGITNLLFKASISSSGGSSHGSAGLSSGSSDGSHKGSAHATEAIKT